MNYEQTDNMTGEMEDLTSQGIEGSEVEMPDAEGPEEESIERTVYALNLADGLDEQKLKDIGRECLEGFEADFSSREDWVSDLDAYTKLAMQIRENKSFPWQGCSNVKYPLLSTSAMQFAARAYPALVPSNGKIVKTVVVGKDPTGEKKNKADRVSTYMSWQILKNMDNWEEDMDKLLIMLPIAGTMFKKTYYDANTEKVSSRLVLPKNLVVDNWTKTLDEAERISEIFTLTPRALKERQRQGIYLDIDLGTQNAIPDKDDNRSHPRVDDATPYTFVEQHTYIDMDDDGYAEPYIVVFHRNTGKVLRISVRFEKEDIETNKDGQISKITPIQYYTKFSFVPNPDGSFYDIGFGNLLGPLNEAINTHINQLTDAGTINTLAGGFIGKGLRIKSGDYEFRPNEWKPVNSTGDDLRKQIVPLPTKEPSPVLLQLMQALITSGKELASVAEIFVGKSPGQNTPATTTMATIEQGMKVFTAVYKRIYRSLASEFYKIYELNETYIDPNTYVAVLDEAIGPEDFSDDNYDICPGADPNAMSDTEKLMKAQGLMELMPMGILDPVKVGLRILETQEQPNYEELLIPSVKETGQPPPPPPDPKMLEMDMKGKLKQQELAQKAEIADRKMKLDTISTVAKIAMDGMSKAQDMQDKAALAQTQAAVEDHKQKIFSAQAQADHIQQLIHNQQKHNQNLHLTKEKAKLSLSQKSKSGKTAQ
jgi:chaperonin GroES